MAELHRIVTLNSGGRPSVVLDLADGVSTALVADTLQVTPYNETSVYTQALRRYGGTKKVAEMHNNGSLAAEYYLGDGSSTVQAQGIFDDLAGILEDSTTQFYYEWRPEGAAVSTYYEIRGSEPYELMYRWVEVAGTRRLHVKMTVQTAPLARGLPMDIYDGFGVDSSADYTKDADSSSLSITGGQLVPAATSGESLWVYTARGYRPPDAQVTLKFTTGAAVTATHRTGVLVKRLDASNSLRVQLTSGNALQIAKVDGGTLSTLGTAVSFTPAANTSYWIRGRIEGNVATAEIFTSAPSPLATPAATYSVTLSGADATKYGAGVAGDQGLIAWARGTDWRYDDFEVLPYTYRNHALPDLFTLPGLPGNAPSDTDVWLTTKYSGSNGLPFALIGWPAVALDSSAATIVEGTSTSDANAVGGNYVASVNDNGAAVSKLTWALGSFVPDDFLDETALEVWVRVKSSPIPTANVTLKVELLDPSGLVATYTDEFGSSGRSVTRASGGADLSAWRFSRGGILHVPTGGANYILRVTLSASSTSSLIPGIDHVIIVPARSRAATYTGKAQDTFPFIPGASVEYTKIIQSDLSGLLIGEGGSTPQSQKLGARHLSMGGTQLAPAPGESVAIKLSQAVPDDPTLTDASGNGDPVSVASTVHFSVTPRYFLMRSS